VRNRKRSRRLSLAVAALVLSLASSLAAQTPQWKSFGTAAEGFQALFPSTPEARKNSVSAGANSYELRSYVAQTGSVTLYVAVCDYGLKGHSADPGNILADAEKAAATHMAATILIEKTITLDANSGDAAQTAPIHGIEFEAANDKMQLIARIYISGGVLYQVMVTSPANEKFADTARFLASFRLLPLTRPESSN
jgi:hypothetical protein